MREGGGSQRRCGTFFVSFVTCWMHASTRISQVVLSRGLFGYTHYLPSARVNKCHKNEWICHMKIRKKSVLTLLYLYQAPCACKRLFRQLNISEYLLSPSLLDSMTSKCDSHRDAIHTWTSPLLNPQHMSLIPSSSYSHLYTLWHQPWERGSLVQQSNK